MVKNIVLSIVLLSSIFVMGVSAQDAGGGIGGRPAYPRQDNQRSESIFIHTIENGQSVDDGINVINNTNEQKTVAVYATDALVASGGAFSCEQQVDDVDESGSWIELTRNELTLEEAENQVVDFTITVPENADVGEHNACVVVQEQKPPTEADQGIGLSFRTAIRVAILVPGEINKQLSILRLDVTQDNDNVVLSPTVRNDGNVSIDTDATSLLTTLWGSMVSEVGGEFPVLRDQEATWNFRHDKPFWGGFYGTVIDATYDNSADTFLGDDVQEFTALSANGPTVFVMPHPLAILLYVVLIGLLLYGVYRARKRRQAKQSIKSWTNYQVKQGDDIKQLSESRNVGWKIVAKVNNLKAPYTLKPGQQIKLPPKK